MGLYLCVFDEDEELEGVEVGSYSDFEFFRSSVTELLEQGSSSIFSDFHRRHQVSQLALITPK